MVFGLRSAFKKQKTKPKDMNVFKGITAGKDSVDGYGGKRKEERGKRKGERGKGIPLKK